MSSNLCCWKTTRRLVQQSVGSRAMLSIISGTLCADVSCCECAVSQPHCLLSCCSPRSPPESKHRSIQCVGTQSGTSPLILSMKPTVCGMHSDTRLHIYQQTKALIHWRSSSLRPAYIQLAVCTSHSLTKVIKEAEKHI